MTNGRPEETDPYVAMSVRHSVHVWKPLFPVDWRLLAKECIVKIGISLSIYIALLIIVFALYFFLLFFGYSLTYDDSKFDAILRRKGILWYKKEKKKILPILLDTSLTNA